MKKLHIPSENIAFTLELDVVVTKPSALVFVGYDPTKPHTAYFRRKFGSAEKPFMGKKRFYFPLPMSPKKLKVDVYDSFDPDRKDALDVTRIKAIPLEQKKAFVYPDDQEKRFCDFAMWFTERAGYLRPKHYPYSSGNPDNFMIKYSNHIKNRETGANLNTPARVSRVTGGIEASRSYMIRETIPIRMFILLHERVHYAKNTRSEINADMSALNMYLQMGFPKTEAIYAVTNILDDNKYNRQRVQEMMNHINNYNY